MPRANVDTINFLLLNTRPITAIARGRVRPEKMTDRPCADAPEKRLLLATSPTRKKRVVLRRREVVNGAVSRSQSVSFEITESVCGLRAKSHVEVRHHRFLGYCIAWIGRCDKSHRG